MIATPSASRRQNVGKTYGTCRAATRADIPRLAQIVHDWEAASDWNPSQVGVEVIAGALEAAFDAREIWVIGAPAEGYLSLNPETAHIGGFYVATQGRGIGKALMDRAKAGRDFLSLNTHVPNVEAHRFYAREGFVTVAELPPSVADAPAELRMEWHREAGDA